MAGKSKRKDPEKKSKGNGKTDPTPPVNKQIVEAVKKSTDFVFGQPEEKSTTAATAGSGDLAPKYDAAKAIAYEKVAQAVAYGVQDATDYQRNILSMSSVAQGKALAKMFEDVAEEDLEALGMHAAIFILAIVGSVAAGATAGFIGTEEADTLSKFSS